MSGATEYDAPSAARPHGIVKSDVAAGLVVVVVDVDVVDVIDLAVLEVEPAGMLVVDPELGSTGAVLASVVPMTFSETENWPKSPRHI